MTMIDVEETITWQGDAVSCDGCERRELLESGGCQLKHACVNDRYAKRIDRFFKQNQALAKDYLAHPYFEVRAVAAKYADMFHLPGLLHDPDETVRWSAAQRLPQRYLLLMRADPDREVRIRVAARLDESYLGSMINDTDYYVRQVVARRIVPGMLVLMMRDPDREVRMTVVKRIGDEWLAGMVRDEDSGVRIVVASRVATQHLPLLLDDPDWRVRYEVAGRIDSGFLGRLLKDLEDEVRERAQERLDKLAGANVVAMYEGKWNG